MIRRLVFLAAAMAMSGPAFSQSDPSVERVRVRAGEHAGFSRLAVDLPGLEAWSVDLEGRQLMLRVPGRAIEFDLRQIFPERRVTRVTSARQERTSAGGAALRFTLSCDCEAEAYRFGEDMLVIDLRDRVRETADSRQIPQSMGETPSDWAEAAPQPAEARRATASDAPPSEDKEASEFSPEDPKSEPIEAPEDRTLTVEEARERLLQQLARAADQGLIELQAPEGEASVATESPSLVSPDPETQPEAEDDPVQREASAPEPDETSDRESDDPPRDLHLDVRTAFDPMPWPEMADDAAVPDCAAAVWIDATTWIAPEPAPEAVLLSRIAVLRAALVSDLDRHDDALAARLAETYLALGLGSEARQALSMLDAGSERLDWLRAAAAIIDDSPIEARERFEPVKACGGHLGLWRLAAGLRPDPARLEDDAWRRSVLSAGEALPDPVARVVAPAALQTLIDMEALDLAGVLAAHIDRRPGDLGDAWRLAIARLERAAGSSSLARSTLEGVASGSGPASERALLELVRADLEAERAVPDARIERLGAAAFMHRETELGLDLLAAEIRARSGKGELQALFDAAKGALPLREGQDDSVDAALRRALETLSAEKVGPAIYAESVLANRASIGVTSEWAAARRRVSEELIGLGLPNAAADMLAPLVERDESDDRIAVARADAAMWRHEAALARLEGIDGSDAARLRNDVYRLAGRYDEAFAAAKENGGGVADAGALAFLAGRWADADAAELDAVRALLAEGMADGFAESLRLPVADGPAPPTVPPPGPPSLAQAREAMARAARIRQLVEEVLEDG